MIFPLADYELITASTNLLLALAIGIAFGVVLEQGGLGDARKLIGQFTLTDLSVFKVMFSSIVTASFGLFFCERLGWLNSELIQFADTHLLPQIVGGFLLGVGFAMAGYCPGTTLVGVASGKRDALAALAGLVLGSWLFVVGYEWLAEFYLGNPIVQDKLYQLTALSHAGWVFLLGIAAVIGFAFAERIEQKQQSLEAKYA